MMNEFHPTQRTSHTAYCQTDPEVSLCIHRLMFYKHKRIGEGYTHKDEVSEAKLHCAEHAQDDDHDVQEVGQDGGPLVAQEIKHLPLKSCHLGDRGRGICI